MIDGTMNDEATPGVRWSNYSPANGLQALMIHDRPIKAAKLPMFADTGMNSMAYDESLADRVRTLFSRRSVAFEEKRMMGGLCFMVDGKMCVGIEGARLMVRLDPAIYEQSLLQPGCVPMDFTGRPMRGFVFVASEGIATEKLLDAWIGKALDFNPRAKAARTKKTGTRGSHRKKDRKKP